MLGAKALAILHELELVGERQLTEVTQLLGGYRIFRLRETIDEPKRVRGADPRMERIARARAVQIHECFGFDADQFGDRCTIIERAQRSADAIGAVHRMPKPRHAERIAGAEAA